MVSIFLIYAKHFVIHSELFHIIQEKYWKKNQEKTIHEENKRKTMKKPGSGKVTEIEKPYQMAGMAFAMIGPLANDQHFQNSNHIIGCTNIKLPNYALFYLSRMILIFLETL